MQASSIPYKFAEIWAAAAAAGYINTPIPDTVSGALASQHLGFPPITALPIGSGGIPPNIADFNGVLSYLSAWAQWVQAGGPVAWDSTFSTNIGGYPKGTAVLSATTAQKLWISTTDNNTTNPDTGGAGWIPFGLAANNTWTGATNTFSNNVAITGNLTMTGGADNIQLGPMSVLNPAGTLMSVENDAGGAAAQFCANTSATTATIKSQVQSTNCALMSFFFGTSSNVGTITTDTVNTHYNTTSDQRLKIDEGLISADDAGRIIAGLRPRWFRWKSKPDADAEPGFFAQQVARVFPWAVRKGQGRPGSKNFQPWQMDAAKLMPVVIAELQALRKRVAELEG